MREIHTHIRQTVAFSLLTPSCHTGVLRLSAQDGLSSAHDAYAEAGSVAAEARARSNLCMLAPLPHPRVPQALGAARTIASLGIERQSARRYDVLLAKAERAGVRMSVLRSLGIALMIGSVMVGQHPTDLHPPCAANTERPIAVHRSFSAPN